MTAIGFVGTGHIAAPMVRFLAAKGHEITLTRRNAQLSQALAQSHGARVADTAQEVLDAADVVFLCLRPGLAQDVIAPLRFRGDQRIVSVMAGVSRATLATICAPATQIVQTIPLGYLEQGGCPLAAFGDHPVLERLFAPENIVVPVESEAALNAHFAICALVPGLLDLMNTGATWLAAQTGDADRAEVYTTQLVAGFLDALDTGRAGRLAKERDALATEGTLSLQMTQALHSGGAHVALRDALDAIGARLS